jgi:hypothetical protein
VDATSGLVSDLEALAGEQSQRRGPECTVGAILGRLAGTDPDAAAALGKALDDPRIGGTRIATVLAGHGNLVQSGTVARHRRRGAPNGCRCPR